MSSQLNRRDFIKATTSIAGVAAVTLVPRHVLGGPRQTPPSEKMNVAGVGVGGMGAANLANLAGENIVALCDVRSQLCRGNDQAISQGQVLHRLS